MGGETGPQEERGGRESCRCVEEARWRGIEVAGETTRGGARRGGERGEGRGEKDSRGGEGEAEGGPRAGGRVEVDAWGEAASGERTGLAAFRFLESDVGRGTLCSFSGDESRSKGFEFSFGELELDEEDLKNEKLTVQATSIAA